MSVHDLRTRPDLQPLFGPLEPQVNDALLDRLLDIDARLTKLALDATNHIEVVYKHSGLSLFVRNGNAEISGGPTGLAGDIWFEVAFSIGARTRRIAAPPWTVDSKVVVFCVDAPEGRGETNTHDLVSLSRLAFSPTTAIEALAEQLEMISQEIFKRPASTFTQTPHAQLP